MPKPKLTPEEKKLLKEQKKAEKKRLAELKKRQQKHDHLSREFKYGQLTIKKHEKNWKRMLISVTLPRMQEDLWFAWHNFERVIDSKDFSISLLMDEIRDAEEQYMMNLRCHTENIDNLIIRFRDRLDELNESNEADLASMQAFSEKEVGDIRQNFSETEVYIKTMLFGLQMARKEQEQLVRGDYLSKIDEETTKYTDIQQALKAGLERRFSNIWDKTKTFLKNYTVQKADRRKEYTALAQQDDTLQDLCSMQLIKLQSMQEYIKKLKVQYTGLQETQGEKINDLLHERQYFADAFTTLKDRFDADRALDSNNLALMTAKSNDAMEHLQAIAKKGRRILQLSAICRKLETQEEKILPFPNPTSTSQDLISGSDIKLEEYKNTANLHLFWQRVAQADAVRHSINEEREALKRENKTLKQKIHYYCQCLDCASLEVNQKPNKKLVGKPNVVDGNILKKNYMKY